MEDYEKLIIDNEKLVYHVIKQLHLYSQIEEYWDIGVIGLCKAAKTFNKSNGSKFSTYAYICIKNSILMSIRDHKRQADYYAISIETPINYDKNGHEQKLEDIIPDYSLEDDIYDNENKTMLKNAIEKLNGKDKEIIDLYFYKNMKQREISKLLNTSQANVSRLIRKAINNLKKGDLFNERF